MNVEGGVRAVDIYDTTAIDARYRLAAGMYAWMAPPEQKWFELQAQDRELAEDDEIKIKLNGAFSPMTILPKEGSSFLFLVLPVRL